MDIDEEPARFQDLEAEVLVNKPKKPMKVWSIDGRLRKAVVSSTFSEFKTSAEEKFDVESARFVLFNDGTEVDEEYWETLKPDTVVAILSPDDAWLPQPGLVPSVDDPTNRTNEATGSSDKEQRVHELLEKLRKKKPVDGIDDLMFAPVVHLHTADFNISSALRRAIQDQWSSGIILEKGISYYAIEN